MALVQTRLLLGEILANSDYVDRDQIAIALSEKRPDEKLGTYLIARGQLTEQHLYEALAIQQDLPLGIPESISVAVTRSIPAAVARKWAVLPFRVTAGELRVAGTEVPSDAMTSEIQGYCPLEIRFQLVTPTDFQYLMDEYLPSVPTCSDD
jgi:type IV pilus assembly protein PilB